MAPAMGMSENTRKNRPRRCESGILAKEGDSAFLERLPRCRVAQIAADHIGNGWSAEEIIREYPHLTAAKIDRNAPFS
jgi:hypothetical protein